MLDYFFFCHLVIVKIFTLLQQRFFIQKRWKILWSTWWRKITLEIKITKSNKRKKNYKIILLNKYEFHYAGAPIAICQYISHKIYEIFFILVKYLASHIFNRWKFFMTKIFLHFHIINGPININKLIFDFLKVQHRQKWMTFSIST